MAKEITRRQEAKQEAKHGLLQGDDDDIENHARRAEEELTEGGEQQADVRVRKQKKV